MSTDKKPVRMSGRSAFARSGAQLEARRLYAADFSDQKN